MRVNVGYVLLSMLSLYVLSMICNSDCLFGQRKKPHIKGVINTKGKKDTKAHARFFYHTMSMM